MAVINLFHSSSHLSLTSNIKSSSDTQSNTEPLHSGNLGERGNWPLYIERFPCGKGCNVTTIFFSEMRHLYLKVVAIVDLRLVRLNFDRFGMLKKKKI